MDAKLEEIIGPRGSIPSLTSSRGRLGTWRNTLWGCSLQSIQPEGLASPQAAIGRD
jgi:hypothetical protein